MPTTATKKEQLKAEIHRLMAEVNAINDAESAAQAAALVGKFFKYRTCYSCPQSEADYWWLYVAVTGVGEAGAMKGWAFQIDKDHKIIVEDAEPFARGGLMQPGNGYIEIGEQEFYDAFASVVDRVNALARREFFKRSTRRNPVKAR